MPAINKTICVCGAGTMGAGITQAAAQQGFAVILYDLNPAVLQQARDQVENNLQVLHEKQKLSLAEKASIIENIQWSGDINQCRAEIIIEAIVENLPAKIDLFKQLAAINGPTAIYASNTSSLAITAIALAHPFPARVAGLHFFNPATLMKLVEVVQTIHSADNTIQTLVQLVKNLGKTPVVCNDAPGFIVNRVARPFYIESLRLAEEGIPIPVIDALMTAAGFKMGPFRLMDLIGNDINYAVSCSIYEQMGEPARLKPSFIQQEKVAQGKLGRKSGAGYYTYSA
ncbi:3-hydroxyacyl-CoA dehydrogenase NAD-binding domain-containing protein [Flavihumibacter fluvii]|uniref:3-hydroxyacyl-CoA dehydrogenase NAD-binding domain-containing protein n=1 Tax=Flavihumibacter fluvii TaxID=2838157 RepID=UPI001BDEFC25|nr:3-hydroxyacyl-CoA dehydrogenase NAD-binding domain-containing protein [Flavihumibacter fluvii]ULQ52285.1 3-hydroxyacyl-CoA dehydrogenase NAD-binding domain-containing protein [Flavihumibacter fluvii]